MRLKAIVTLFFVCLFVLVSTQDSSAVGRTTYGSKKKPSKSTQKPARPNGKEKPYDELIKDKVKIEGLFTFYLDTTDNSVLMSITPEQFGPYFLCGMGRSAGDGTYYDTGPIGYTFPFYFAKVGNNVMVMEKNLRVRSDSANVEFNAVQKGISDHLFASIPVKSQPNDSTNAILIDASPLFLRDAEYTSYYLGQRARTGVNFDKNNSYFHDIKSFPMNSEISVKLHFHSGQPNSINTLQNGTSFYHTYHYSLSAIPESDYVPRYSDDRVGYFETIYHDYSEMDKESSYIRYIDRWNLKKKNPEARISEPVKPIVYWIENTVPEEYRDAFAEGIEFWNASFEKLGYRNAVVAKQMPDSADWDPLDARYSTVRWMIAPGRTYAIGPHRANPFTGEILDADISVSSDFIRIMFNTMENFIEPVQADGSTPEKDDFLPPELKNGHDACNFAEGHAQEGAFGLTYLLSNAGAFADKDSLTKEYVHAYIVELIAHEVGHTLGFRHNFKASTIYSLEQLQDREFTKKHSTVGTVMEYAAPNLALKGEPQGEFYGSVPGPFDHWRVEYGYKDFGAASPDDEVEQLKEIASRSGDDLLVYATDYDLSYFDVDPLTNRFDLGNDPIKFCERKIKMTKELWNNTINKFEKDGESFEKLRRVFGFGWRSYSESAIFVPRYISGLYHDKSYLGDADNVIPFKPVPASEQKRALDFLDKYIFGADAFELPKGLLNKLQSSRNGTYEGSLYSTPIAYPWYQNVLNVQYRSLYRLYNPQTLVRLLNNETRYENEIDKYTMENLFTDVRRMIWSEIVKPANVNTYRRQLQLAHLRIISNIYLSSSVEYHTDARTLAANDLEILYDAADKAVKTGNLDNISKAHFKEVLRQINSVRESDRDFSIFGM